MRDSIQISCISNSNLSTHPNNSLVQFTNVFPEKNNFNSSQIERWGIAVKSVTFDNNFKCLPNFSHRSFLQPPNTVVHGGSEHEYGIGVWYKNKLICLLIIDIYEKISPEDLVLRINQTVSTEMGKVVRANNDLMEYVQHTRTPLSYYFDLKWIPEKKKIQLNGHDCEVYLSQVINYAFKFPSSLDNCVLPESVADSFSNEKYPCRIELNGEAIESESEIIDYGNEFKNEKLPKFIQVFVDQVDSQSDNNRQSKCICEVPISKKTKEVKETYFEPEIPKYFPLFQSTLSELSITLADENGEEIKLGFGQSTIVNFNLKKIANTMANGETFHVRLSSNKDNTDSRVSNNSNNCFEVLLPPLYSQLDYSDWEVALHSVFLPKITLPINEYNYKDFWIKLSGDAANLNDLTVIDYVLIKPFSDTSKDYSSFKVFQNYINSCLNEQATKYTCEIVFNEEGKEGNEDVIKIVSDSGPIVILFSPQLWFLITGEPDPNVLLVKNTHVKKINYDLDRLECHNVLLYANIIESHYFGDSFSKILHQIPIQHNYKKEEEDKDIQYYHHQCKHLSFHAIGSSLHKIKIELRDTAGWLIKYSNQQLPSIINLIFRRHNNE